MPDDLSVLFDEASARGSAAPPRLFETLVARHRRRHRARVVGSVLASVVAVLATAVTVSVVGHERQRAVPADETRRWEQLPPAPLSARYNPLAAAVGNEFLVIGGDSGSCGPGAICSLGPGPRKAAASPRDGAAFDLTTSTWRKLSRAPQSVPVNGTHAVVGDVLHLLTRRGHHLAYDVSEDRWSELPPPHDFLRKAFIASDTQLFATAVTGIDPDQVFDATTRTWSELPRDPQATVYGREVAWAGDRLTAFSRTSSSAPTGVHVSTLVPGDDRWKVLPVQESLATKGWSWDGHRLVSNSAFLSPTTGEWSPIPRPPDISSYRPFGGWPDGVRFKSLGPLLFDAVEERWIRVPDPGTVPVGRFGATAWVGDTLVYWGGWARTGSQRLTTGGLLQFGD